MSLCCECKERESGKGKRFSIEVDGFRFYDRAFTECMECAGQRFAKRVHDNWTYDLRQMVRRDENKIAVDWQYVNREHASGKLIAILCALDILTTHIDNNWEIVAYGPIGLNPRTAAGTYLYFTQVADAIGFAKTTYANTMYSWHICQMTHVIWKSDALSKNADAAEIDEP